MVLRKLLIYTSVIPLFVCFLDASKAFDKIDYWLLFEKLIDRHFPIFIVRLLAFWYSSQSMNVRWGSALSDSFLVSNGVRQGGIMSPLFFNIYMNDLSIALNNSGIGCNFNGDVINHFIYADDMCLVAPCTKALQKLVDVCTDFASSACVLSQKSINLTICQMYIWMTTCCSMLPVINI